MEALQMLYQNWGPKTPSLKPKTPTLCFCVTGYLLNEDVRTQISTQEFARHSNAALWFLDVLLRGMKFKEQNALRDLRSGAFCSCGTVLRDLKKYEFDLPSIIWQGGYIKWNMSHFKGYITKNFYTSHRICIHYLIDIFFGNI